MGLTDLPSELILRIFQHANDFTSVIALVRTSSIFHCVWLMNANTIALAVLPKAVECYHEAHSLVEAQERAEGSEHPSGGRHKSHRELIIGLVRRYLGNARVVTSFHTSFILPVLERSGSNEGNLYARPLLERKRFLRTLYHLKALAILHKAKDINPPILLGMTVDDLTDISEVACWIRVRVPMERRRELGVDDFLTESWWLQGWLDNRLAAIHSTQASDG